MIEKSIPTELQKDVLKNFPEKKNKKNIYERLSNGIPGGISKEISIQFPEETSWKPLWNGGILKINPIKILQRTTS